ncbi:related to 50S ribosomal protein L3 [Hanseniaspora guilliermondii]|uniref:Large ribosomal subunit protein uL3m n=1 Tax=Hanseniaspora guilliermondii TaxID=56406 RepID=A0A1L0AYT0_9ASCO|nr:related to 50S ribosomal protein L3 [Hanseniaspora guilliermondii]
MYGSTLSAARYFSYTNKSLNEVAQSIPKLTSSQTINVKNFKSLSLLTDYSNILHRRINITKRPGAIARKLGASAYFTEDGQRLFCTVLEFNNVEVIKKVIDEEKCLYINEIGFGWKHPRKVNKSLQGIYNSLNTSVKMKVISSRVKTPEALLEPGTLLKPSYFKTGAFVDVRGEIKGKGFQGVIKRWNFKMQPKSHGNTKTVRHRGAFGGNTEPARVFPGTKMAGRYGFKNTVRYNLEVLEADDELGTLVVKGSVPGEKGEFITLRDAIKIYH